MASSEYKLSNGQAFRLVTTTGTVLSTTRDHKLQIHQGAATILPQGTVLPGGITSSTRTTQEVWIKTSNGKEEAVKLESFTVPMREGHQISVVSGSPLGSEQQTVFGVRNHTADRTEARVAPMRGVLSDWKLDVGASASVARWALVPAALFGGLVFFKMDPSGDRPLFAAMAAGFGAILGISAWLNVGSGMGTKARTDALLKEIKELGLTELGRAGD